MTLDRSAYLGDVIWNTPYRAGLYALLPLAFVWQRLRPEPALRRLRLVWLALGLGEAVPTILALLKFPGAPNNLSSVDLWAASGILPVAWYALARLLRGGPGRRELAAVPIGLLLLLLVCASPRKGVPGQAHWTLGRRLDAALASSRARDERILLLHGTSSLVHAGYRQAPMDRAVSHLELILGGKWALARTKERLRSHYYERIFVNVGLEPWYGGLTNEINKHYRQVAMIQGPTGHGDSLGLDFGFQPELASDVRVLVPREEVAAASGPQ